MNILITSVGTVTSVNLIRYFGNMGHYIVGTDINEYGLTAGSQLVDKFVRVPLAVDPEFIEVINGIIKDKDIDVVIPINDIEVYIFSKNKTDIPCACIIPNTETIETLRDKFICCNCMDDLGIPVPMILDKKSEGIKRILRDRIGVGSKGIEVLEINQNTPNYDENDKFLQTFIEGDEYTVDILADLDGNPIYIIPRRRIEVKSGVATKVKIVKDEVIIGYVERILKEYKIPGFSNIQLFRDYEGKYWFIEANYRFAGCGAATLATSKNYLYEFEKIVKGEKNTEILNADTRWNSIVTRYYEEIVYENSIS